MNTTLANEVLGGVAIVKVLSFFFLIVFQGLPIKTLVDFEDVLFIASSLAMKGSYFLGELPSWLAEAEIKSRVSLL